MTTCEGIDVYPYTFLRVLTFSWHFQAPINFYAFYCIIFLSPKVMNTFRWHLFVYQLSSTFLDFTFAIGITPVVVPAMTMGYSVGLKLSLFTYYSIWLLAMTTSFLSIACIHYALETDQILMISKWKEIYSCAVFLHEQPSAWICEARKYLWVVLYGVISCCIGGFFMLLFLQQSLSAIGKMASNRSIHARNVQKKLILLLCAQLLFPLVAYAIGGTTIIISLALQLVFMQGSKSKLKTNGNTIIRVSYRS
uniref:Uncharacterized protein n=1 Tax=Caenorhabditis japonica TaxID=281687 RepID=A0A8R1I139_CAEJA